jgi:hypothetical protein
MKPVDLKYLIKGVLTVIALAWSLGHYEDLKLFAQREWVRSMAGGKTPPFFKVNQLDKNR